MNKTQRERLSKKIGDEICDFLEESHLEKYRDRQQIAIPISFTFDAIPIKNYPDGREFGSICLVSLPFCYQWDNDEKSIKGVTIHQYLDEVNDV